MMHKNGMKIRISKGWIKLEKLRFDALNVVLEIFEAFYVFMKRNFMKNASWTDLMFFLLS